MTVQPVVAAGLSGRARSAHPISPQSSFPVQPWCNSVRRTHPYSSYYPISASWTNIRSGTKNGGRSINAVCSATWVSFYHGGGSGIGFSQCTGHMIVADFTSEAALHLKRVLSIDPGIVMVGHADASYPQAITSITEHKIKMPVLNKIPGE